MYRVFTSYPQEHLDSANHLRGLLSDVGVEVFVAEHDVAASDPLGDEIAIYIKRCDLFVLLWCKHADASKYVHKELFLAKSEGKTILPVALDSSEDLPDELGDTKYLDVTEDPQQELQWLRQFVRSQAVSKSRSNAVAVALFGFLAYAALAGGE